MKKAFVYKFGRVWILESLTNDCLFHSKQFNTLKEAKAYCKINKTSLVRAYNCDSDGD